MLDDAIKVLIEDEYARHGSDFIGGVDLQAYLAKLDRHAEVIAESVSGRCRGFVAFYCNDALARRAYITLVLVDPRDRGRGLGKALVGDVLDTARQRGFDSCSLEVRRTNETAYAMYRSLGFRVAEIREHADLLEIAL
jgi:ribosomal protein S18 acetylase RimI-like enzyme